jgi:AcrR family transcriptional regulator
MKGLEDAVITRGRPREFCPDQALAAALRVFWRRGYEGASLTELTEAMGINRPSLYACFGNKEALFRKALDLYQSEKLAYVQSALDAPTARGVAERLLNGSLAMQSGTADPKGCLGVISSVVACGAEAESIRSEVLARRAASDAALVARFERAKAEGDLPETIDPASLARYLGAIMQGLSVQASNGVGCGELRGLVDTALAMWPGR